MSRQARRSPPLGARARGNGRTNGRWPAGERLQHRASSSWRHAGDEATTWWIAVERASDGRGSGARERLENLCPAGLGADRPPAPDPAHSAAGAAQRGRSAHALGRRRSSPTPAFASSVGCRMLATVRSNSSACSRARLRRQRTRAARTTPANERSMSSTAPKPNARATFFAAIVARRLRRPRAHRPHPSRRTARTHPDMGARRARPRPQPTALCRARRHAPI